MVNRSYIDKFIKMRKNERKTLVHVIAHEHSHAFFRSPVLEAQHFDKIQNVLVIGFVIAARLS